MNWDRLKRSNVAKDGLDGLMPWDHSACNIRLCAGWYSNTYSSRTSSPAQISKVQGPPKRQSFSALFLFLGPKGIQKTDAQNSKYALHSVSMSLTLMLSSPALDTTSVPLRVVFNIILLQWMRPGRLTRLDTSADRSSRFRYPAQTFGSFALNGNPSMVALYLFLIHVCALTVSDSAMRNAITLSFCLSLRLCSIPTGWWLRYFDGPFFSTRMDISIFILFKRKRHGQEGRFNGVSPIDYAY